MTDEQIKFDPEDLTLDEIEEAEELLGEPIDGLLGGNKPKAKALKVLVFLIMRRDDPDLTLESVGSIKLSQLSMGND